MKSSLKALLLYAIALSVNAQQPLTPGGTPNATWQSFYEVTQPLTNATFLGHSYAGNIPIERGNGSLSLFYWAVESKNGSFTSNDTTEPWHIWLNGGPGSSSMLGFHFENGPVRILANYSAVDNPYSWDKLVDTIWIDQPVGVGYATLQPNSSNSHQGGYSGWAADEDVMGSDFIEFLGNLVKVFPNLATRPLHLMGESYAGTYIPYITKAYFQTPNPPVKLAKIAIGDGTIGNGQVFEEVPTIYTLQILPQIIGYDEEVYNYFAEQNHLCKYDVNLTYPQNGKIPTVEFLTSSGSQRQGPKQNFVDAVRARYQNRLEKGLVKRDEDRDAAKNAWKAANLGSNGTINAQYGCDIYDEALDYAVNHTYPWNQDPSGGSIDVYNIPSALDPSSFEDASVFLNDPANRAALHAPNKTWESSIRYYFTNGEGGNDPSPEPMVFLDDLATNATNNGVSVIIYSGNLDSLVAHRGSEIVIQNTTFGGIQGFTRKPSTPWYSDDGTFAGIVHQERNWTYVLFQAAGHLVPMQQPVAAFTFIREYVLGTNETGLVTPGGVIGGEDPTLYADVLREIPDIYTGSYVTEGTTVYPSATIGQWETFLAALTATTTLPPFTSLTGTPATNTNTVTKPSSVATSVPTSVPSSSSSL